MTEIESNEVSVSKEDLAEAAEVIDEAAVETGVAGVEDVAEGLDALDVAGDVAGMATAEAMAGAADITRAVDAEVGAGRLADLADVVAEVFALELDRLRSRPVRVPREPSATSARDERILQDPDDLGLPKDHVQKMYDEGGKMLPIVRESPFRAAWAAARPLIGSRSR